jgi:hypothetical protein
VRFSYRLLLDLSAGFILRVHHRRSGPCQLAAAQIDRIEIRRGLCRTEKRRRRHRPSQHCSAWRSNPCSTLVKHLPLIIEESVMPLVRIDLPESIDAPTGVRIGEAIYQAMTELIGVPHDDKFQVISRHSRQGRNLPAEYLGVRYSDKLVLIQITLNQGRTVEQKKTFFKRVANDLAGLGLRKEDVIINLVEVAKENWSFGNGEMQYGPK